MPVGPDIYNHCPGVVDPSAITVGRLYSDDMPSWCYVIEVNPACLAGGCPWRRVETAAIEDLGIAYMVDGGKLQ